jgi:AcrR family transcriptional regulator
VDATLRLLDEDPEALPSMSAIAQTAGVSRTSVYKQFPDLTALAVELMRTTFEDLGRADVDRRRAPLENPGSSAWIALRGFVEHVRRYRSFYRSSLEWTVTSRVHEELVDSYADRIRRSATLMPLAPSGDTLEDEAIFVAGGVISLVTAWIRHDDPVLVLPEMADTAADRLVGLLPAWMAQPT